MTGTSKRFAIEEIKIIFPLLSLYIEIISVIWKLEMFAPPPTDDMVFTFYLENLFFDLNQ